MCIKHKTPLFGLACWSALVCITASLFAQTSPARPSADSSYTPHLSFDIISIHESNDGNMSYVDNPPQTSYYHAVRMRPWGLILHAYDLHLGNRVKNVPSWAMSTPYDITAKSDDATDQELAKLNEDDFRSEKRHMLQGFLIDRFKLQIHSETMVATTYELVSTPRAAQLMMPVQGDVAKIVSTCNQHYFRKGIEIDAKGCPFHTLLSTISQTLGTDVVDRTGMTGVYAYQLMWSPTDMPQKDDDPFPHIVDAVREQLGLELKPTKAPVTFWIVDHIERPTPN